jgi:long-chain acyl-CoA synthetase
MTEHEHSVFPDRPWTAFFKPNTKAGVRQPHWKNLREMLLETAKTYGDNTAYTTVLPNGFSSQHTFSEIDKLSDYFAAYLRLHLRLQKGDRVAIMLPNCAAWPICAFGVLKAGCVLVNTNPMYTEHEMEHLLTDSGATVLIILDLFLGKLDKAIPATQVRHIVATGMGDFFPFPKSALINLSMHIKKQIGKTRMPVHSLPGALRRGARHFKAISPWEQGFWEPKQAHTPNNSIANDSSDIALLQYTGGTTGVSKAAVLTHGNILENMRQIKDFAQERLEPGKETILTALPLYHIFAFTVNGLIFYSLGANNVLIPNPRPISNLKHAFQEYPITWISGVNTLFNALLHEKWFTDHPPKQLKMAIAGGAALQKSVAEKWKQILKIDLFEGYGLTEASPVVCFNPVSCGISPKLGSIGIPMPSTDVRIADDHGHELAVGEVGEIQTKGPQVMHGYWNRPDETALVIRDGWLCTGDIGYMDKHGYFFIVDRKKDMILVSGFNVYPNEIEDVLMQHPDVREAAVIGIPDENMGELVRAYIVSSMGNLSPESLKKHCREYLTSYKVPRQFVFVSELPKSNIGKILRKDLRTAALNEIQNVQKRNA